MNYHKGFVPILLIIIIAVLIGGGYAYSVTKKAGTESAEMASTPENTNLKEVPSSGSEPQAQTTLTVVYPNGGEALRSVDIFYAGDVSLKWTTSKKELYVPTPQLKIYVIARDGIAVQYAYSSTGPQRVDGDIFSVNFNERAPVSPGKEYKIKICDTIGMQEYCDESDNYFSIDSSIDNVRE